MLLCWNILKSSWQLASQDICPLVNCRGLQTTHGQRDSGRARPAGWGGSQLASWEGQAPLRHALEA